MSKASQPFVRQLHMARERLVDTKLSDRALAYFIAGLGRMEKVLARPLRVVILGEYNSGKTSVADLLIGDRLLPTSVVSNTHVPVLISYSENAAVYGITQTEARVRIDGADDDAIGNVSFRALQVALPLDRLKAYQILDTPPGASPAAFVADADIVIWCTVATRAWTESERAAWSTLPHRCWRNGVLVATHKDGLHIEEEVRSVSERLNTLAGDMFRDVVLVSAENVRAGASEQDAEVLRESLAAIVTEITERRARKAMNIVRRLARLTFHHLASSQIRPETASLLAGWEDRSNALLRDLAYGARSVPKTIEDLLRCYAEYAERLRPGGIAAAASGEGTQSRALTTPIQWPSRSPAAQRLVKMLVADLTALLRMQSGSSTFTDPGLVADYQRARMIVLSLADLDGAFDALGRMLGASESAA